MELWERINTDNLWRSLEEAAIQAAIAGGMAAMGYYRDAWQKPIAFDQKEKNPSTLADLQATSTILRTIHSLLSPMTGKLNCALSYLGEETVKDSRLKDWLQKNLSSDVFERVHDPDRFFASPKNTLRVIFDGIDGTGSFTRGLPLFCSAVAILVDDQVRVSAIYDPIHHVMYSGLLPGSDATPETGASASAWEIATGNRTDLVQIAENDVRKELEKEAIGIHLTRSNPIKLKEFLGIDSSSTASVLERLAKASGGIYALNSGLVAMAHVARGALGGFVNIVTHPWDVAAGEVLVRACRGKVTDFNGNPIGYSSTSPVSVICAKGHLHWKVLDILRSKSNSQSHQ